MATYVERIETSATAADAVSRQLAGYGLRRVSSRVLRDGRVVTTYVVPDHIGFSGTPPKNQNPKKPKAASVSRQPS